MAPHRFSESNYHRQVKEPRTSSRALRDFFAVVDYERIPSRIFASSTTANQWRRGHCAPSVLTFEEAVNKIGYRIVLEKIE